MPRSPKWYLPFRISFQTTVCISHLSFPYISHVPTVSSPWFDHHNNIWWTVKTTWLLVKIVSILLKVQQHVLQHPQRMFSPRLINQVLQYHKKQFVQFHLQVNLMCNNHYQILELRRIFEITINSRTYARTDTIFLLNVTMYSMEGIYIKSTYRDKNVGEELPLPNCMTKE
jgi:hypothetical protein